MLAMIIAERKLQSCVLYPHQVRIIAPWVWSLLHFTT